MRASPRQRVRYGRSTHAPPWTSSLGARALASSTPRHTPAAAAHFRACRFHSGAFGCGSPRHALHIEERRGAAVEALPRVLDLMQKELKWSSVRTVSPHTPWPPPTYPAPFNPSPPILLRSSSLPLSLVKRLLSSATTLSHDAESRSPQRRQPFRRTRARIHVKSLARPSPQARKEQERKDAVAFLETMYMPSAGKQRVHVMRSLLISLGFLELHVNAG
eukprot:6203602-Pleurochrysis_carterae.AAC.3